jgi:hypothetical protein
MLNRKWRHGSIGHSNVLISDYGLGSSIHRRRNIQVIIVKLSRKRLKGFALRIELHCVDRSN